MFYFEFAELYPNYKQDITCSSCGKNIANRQPLFECCGCKKCYHPHCKGVVGHHITRKASEPFWFCSDSCQRTKSGPSTPNPVNNKTAEVMQKLKKHDEEFGEIKSIMTEIKASQDFISSEFEKMRLEYQKVVAENTELLEMLRESNAKNKQQQEHINQLEASVDELHQSKINNNLIIAGIPNEDMQPKEVLQNIFQLLDCVDSINDVEKVEYMKQRMHHNTPTDKIDKKIMVTFNTKEAKFKVQEKRKRKMVFLSQVGYNLSVDKPVFFRDHLTLFRLKLYSTARKLNKLINYKFLWINKSVIYFRKEERAPVIRIVSQNDIDNLLFANKIDPNLLN